MIQVKPIGLLTLATLLITNASVLRAEERLRSGLWENTVTSNGTTGSKRRCITPAETETANSSFKTMRETTEKAIAKSGKGACTLKDFTLVGNTISSKMECGALSYVNTTTYKGDSFETVTVYTNETNVKKTLIKGRRIGDCPVP